MKRTKTCCVHPLSGWLLTTSIFMSLWGPAAGFSQGAPFSTCLTMFPKHKTQRQMGPPPFFLSLSPSAYRPGQIITVTLMSSGGHKFRGIQVKAVRSMGDEESALGTFVQTPVNLTKVFTCEGGYKNMVSHTNALVEAHGADTLTMSWKAPETNVGDIVFVATFVESFRTFWTGLRATLATEDRGSVLASQRSLPEVAEDGFASLSFDTCGQDRGCFLYPRFCSGSDCLAAASFRKDGADHFLFELMASGSAYVSIGFSDDMMMGEDETITCTAAGDQIFSVQHGFNPKLYNQRIVRHQLSDLAVNTTDGNIMCTFKRPRVTVTRFVNQSASSLQYIESTYDLGKEYYVMLAWGSVKHGTDVMSKHKDLPPVTDNKVAFDKYEIYRGSVLPIQFRIHASLMAVAWVLVAGLTTAISRYYKHWMGSRVCFGAGVWFQIHRTVGILTAVLTICSVVIAIVYVGGFSDKEPKHAFVGFTVLTLVAIQILAGIFRPDKGSNIRPLFRWAHTIFGQTAHILSAVAMYLAFDIRYIPALMQDFGITVLTGWVPVQIAWTIVLELRRCCTVQHAPRKEVEPWGEVLKSADTVLLIFYCLTLIMLAVATVTTILLF